MGFRSDFLANLLDLSIFISFSNMNTTNKLAVPIYHLLAFEKAIIISVLFIRPWLIAHGHALKDITL